MQYPNNSKECYFFLFLDDINSDLSKNSPDVKKSSELSKNESEDSYSSNNSASEDSLCCICCERPVEVELYCCNNQLCGICLTGWFEDQATRIIEEHPYLKDGLVYPKCGFCRQSWRNMVHFIKFKQFVFFLLPKTKKINLVSLGHVSRSLKHFV